MLPYRDQVLTKLNSFLELQHAEHTALHSEQATIKKLDKKLFVPTYTDCKLPLKVLSGKEKSTFWESTTPQGQARMYAHIAVWSYASLTRTWGSVGRLWLCQLMTTGMLVQNKITKEYSFVLQQVERVAVLGWTVDIVRSGGKDYYFPSTRTPTADNPVRRWFESRYGARYGF